MPKEKQESDNSFDEEEEDEVWHVIPPDDIKEHILDEDCWCEPELHEESNLLVHNSLRDERASAYIH